jgi:hypothetical protein
MSNDRERTVLSEQEHAKEQEAEEAAIGAEDDVMTRQAGATEQEADEAGQGAEDD